MANWYGVWRTNYVKLRADRIDALRNFEVTLAAGDDNTWAILSESEGGEPYCYEASEDLPEWLREFLVNDDYLNLMDCLHEFLEDGEVIVIESSGAEKLRYVTGYSMAIHSSGKSIMINIQDIYEKAKKEFGVSEISQACY